MISYLHADPIPVGLLNQEIIDEFLPQVMSEVAKEFTHQNFDRTLRDTREYGLSFFKMLQGDFSYDPPPAFFQELGREICYALGHEPPPEFTNIILSLYKEGFHLKPHADVSIKNLYYDAPFYFSERVYGIIIEPDSAGHLYFVTWEGEQHSPPDNLPLVFSLQEQAGTIFCLEGDFRFLPYLHGVSPVANKRISITFRTVEKLN